MRLFIGIPFSKELKLMFAESQEALRQYCPQGNYTRRENFHLTLRFLGEYPYEDLAKLQEVLRRTAQSTKSFPCAIFGWGAFLRNNEAIVWTGISRGKQELNQLFSQLESHLTEAGYPKADKGLSPHITLARRVRLSMPIQELSQELPPVVADFYADTIALFISERDDRNLLRYRILAEEKLG